jgi:hypothetical protein
MKRITLLSLLVTISITSMAQTLKDSIDSAHTLQDVLVLAPNMQRMDNYILIRPNGNQRRHSNNAYELLKSCFIPGINVDIQTGRVEAMGAQATLYMNGQPCDGRDLMMLRPRDIEKIEYHDIPVGKYSKDHTAINFVIKEYRYGGYVFVKAQQTIGYTQGIYDLATTLNHGRNTYSIFTGLNYTKVQGNEEKSDEQFRFEVPITRTSNQNSVFKRNDQYVQLRHQYQGKKNYLTIKLTLVNNDMPYNRVYGLSRVSELPDNSFSSQTSQHSLSPKIDLNGEFKFSTTKSLNYGAHFTYDHNKYMRSYDETGFNSLVRESEDAYSFRAACIYNTTLAKGIFTAELFHYHNIWDSHYTESSRLWQHLWKGETLAFVSYNHQLNSKLTLMTRLGVDWLQYHLHNTNDMGQVSPRLNLRLQYRIPNGNLLYSANYVNSNYGTDIINNAEIAIDRYMSVKGNPNLKKSYDFVSYLYYMQQLNKKWTISAISQYNFSHNYVTTDYSSRDDRIIRSYSNDGNTHYFSEIIALSYRLSEHASIGGDIRYAHSWLDAQERIHTNSLMGNINAAYYWREFSIQPSINFRQKSLDFATMTIAEIPINYSMKISYAHKNFYFAANMSSPFSKRRTKTTMNTMAYCQFKEIFDRTQSQYCNLSCTYTFDFGRKTKIISSEIDKGHNSSLLKVQ